MHLKFPPRGSFPRAGANLARNVVNGLNIDPKVPAPTITSRTVSATSVPTTAPSPIRPAPPVGQTPDSAPGTTTSYMNPSSSTATALSSIATPTYPAPIFGSPIQQGPAPSANPGAANAAAHNPTKSKSTLPKGATAAILVVAVIVLLAAGICLFRMWSIRKRKKLRDWWVPEPFLVPTTKKALGDAEKAQQEAMRTIPRVRPPSVPLPPVPAGFGSESAGTDLVSPYGGIAIPPVPPLPVIHQKTSMRRTSSMGPAAPAPIYSPQRSMRAGNIGVVKSIFDPRMHDELRIRVGEALRVLAEYDDGWAFCESARGERGMIPLECLDRGNTARVRARSLVASEESLSVQVGRRSIRKSSLPPKKTQA